MPGAANRGRQAKRPRRAGRMVASPIADPFPTCLYCGKGITTGEPVIVVEHEGQRQTSLAREPTLAERPGALLLHARCAPTGWAGAG